MNLKPDFSMSRQIVLALIDEMDIIRRELERVAVELCTDPSVAALHMETLQRFDGMSQRQEIIAQLLRDGGCEMSVDAIKLEDMRLRIKDRLNTTKVA